jgi:uncharacterized protein (TIGR02284 family)
MTNRLEVLEHLTKVCVDSAERYRRAAADVSEEKFVQFFSRQESARRSQADQLNAQRKVLGGSAEKPGHEAGSIGGFIDRIAMDLNVAMSMGDTGVIGWCRDDAREVIAEYEKALKGSFPDAARAILEHQLEQNRNALAALEKVLNSYGGPRS